MDADTRMSRKQLNNSRETIRESADIATQDRGNQVLSSGELFKNALRMLRKGGKDQLPETQQAIINLLGRQKARRIRRILEPRSAELIEYLSTNSDQVGDRLDDQQTVSEFKQGKSNEACLMMLESLLTDMNTAEPGSTGQSQLADKASNTFEALLDACDKLCLNNAQATIECAADYLENGFLVRAEALLTDLQKTDASNTDALVLHAQVYEAANRWDDSAQMYQRAIESCDDDAELYVDLAVAQLCLLQYDQAIENLTIALKLDEGNEELMEERDRAITLGNLFSDAANQSSMPRIFPDNTEKERQQFKPETLALAVRLYEDYGTLLIEDVFDASLLESCNQQFQHKYRAYLGDEKQDDALQIGHRRFQVSIALEGKFNNPNFYANPFVIDIMHELLGRKAIIGSTVCATSLPGAHDQHLHKDHRALFTETEYDTPIAIPPVAITTMIPLVPLDAQIGSTLVKKGSHVLGKSESEKLSDQIPEVSLGSCFLMDLALSHQGMGNRTNKVRPIVNMVYHQHWFADNKNFKKQPPLQISKSEFSMIPREHRSLLDWCVQPGPQVDC